MCLAIPGKIIKIEKDIATVDYETEKRQAKIVEKGYNIGDYVLVQGQIIIQKVPEQEVAQWLSLFK